MLWAFQEPEGSVCLLAWQANWAQQQLAEAGLVCVSLGSSKKMRTLSET